MSFNLVKKNAVRKNRTHRVRKKLRGTSLRPRLCVIKSNKHIHVQLIDDEAGTTIGSTATFAEGFRNTEFGRRSRASAEQLGKKIAEIAKGYNINQVIFDRGPSKYHGILAALADSARAAGLQI